MIIKQFLVTLIPLIILDGIWLFSTKSFYASKLSYLMGQNVKWAPVVVFYLIYCIAIMVLVGMPGFLHNYGFLKVFLMGALLGLAAYGAYDLTNHAIVKDWPMIITIVDMLWGTVLTGVVAAISVALVKVL